MSSRLIDGLLTTDALSHAFSDEVLIESMLDFEAALARAGAACGAIPMPAGAVIAGAARLTAVDIEALLRGARQNATLSIPLVEALTRHVAAVDPDAARYVHWGATSQDVYDTAIVLCVRRAWRSIQADHARLLSALGGLAETHAGTVMLARTLLQPAVPTTFGLKVAEWLGGVARSWHVWAESYDRTQVLQFGGAAGTLASLGEHAAAVEEGLAGELDLAIPDAPWHAQRDRFANFVATGGVYTGSLAKIARDISLLMQYEVGEVFEEGGGSSTMPHKRNPAGCATVLACAHRLPGLVATMLDCMVQEQERSVGGWHAEAATVADAVQAAGAAVAVLADTVEHLTVDHNRMRRNIESTRGVIFAERVTFEAAPHLGRERAADLVKAAVQSATLSGRTLADTVADSADLRAALSSHGHAALFVPETYLGSADAFRLRLIRASLPATRKH
jgi:3-carboxy-cis,cis-muconate cycloisomerase